MHQRAESQHAQPRNFLLKGRMYKTLIPLLIWRKVLIIKVQVCCQWKNRAAKIVTPVSSGVLIILIKGSDEAIWYRWAGVNSSIIFITSRTRSLWTSSYCEFVRFHPRFFSERHSAQNSSGHRTTTRWFFSIRLMTQVTTYITSMFLRRHVSRRVFLLAIYTNGRSKLFFNI